jgi:hypothetical protein
MLLLFIVRSNVTSNYYLPCLALHTQLVVAVTITVFFQDLCHSAEENGDSCDVALDSLNAKSCSGCSDEMFDGLYSSLVKIRLQAFLMT